MNNAITIEPHQCYVIECDQHLSNNAVRGTQDAFRAITGANVIVLDGGLRLAKTLPDGLQEYLLSHESDIANDINDFGDLKVAFEAAIGREPSG